MRVLLFLCIFAPLGFLGQIGVNGKLDDPKREGPSQGAAQFVPNVPAECLRTGICEDVPDYPEGHVATIIKQLGDAADKYKVDELHASEITQRDGSPEETELCESSKKLVIPKAAADKDGNWRYIINRKDRPMQGFYVEICKNTPCAKEAHFYTGYEASCKQKFMLRYMAALNTTGQMVEQSFPIPNCCSCVVRDTN